MTQKSFGATIKDYVILLPAGIYTSGTYTIPNGYTWDDFEMIIGVLGRGTAQVATSSTTLLKEQISNSNWVAIMSPDSDGQDAASLQRTSANSITVTRARSTGGVNMLIGYLK
jgi:hypothetical protein